VIDDVSDIGAFYNSDPERERYRLEQHQLEYDLTWRYLNQYLPSQGSILEVGAATGKYTLELAKRGYTLTAVDLSAKLIEECRKGIVAEGLERQVRLVVADARDLSEVAEKGFDAVLLMGPLYHLVEETDRKVALKEAFDRLREGGILFSSFISRFGFWAICLKTFRAGLKIKQKYSRCWRAANALMIIHGVGFVDTLHRFLRLPFYMKRLDSKP
jgi:SAM-dependent methyltransferase